MHDMAETKPFAAKAVTLTGASQEILSPSDNRWGVLFFPPQWGVVYLGADTAAVVNQPPGLSHRLPPLWLNRTEHGDIVRRSWNAIFSFMEYGDDKDGVTAQIDMEGNAAAGASLILTVPAVANTYLALTELHGGWTDVTAQSTWHVTVSATVIRAGGFNAGFDLDFNRPPIYGPNLSVTYVITGVAGSSPIGSIHALRLGLPVMTVVEVICPCSYKEILRGSPQLGAAYR